MCNTVVSSSTKPTVPENTEELWCFHFPAEFFQLQVQGFMHRQYSVNTVDHVTQRILSLSHKQTSCCSDFTETASKIIF